MMMMMRISIIILTTFVLQSSSSSSSKSIAESSSLFESTRSATSNAIQSFVLQSSIKSSSWFESTHYNSSILYVPLDERYATRGMFLNMARLTGKNIVTPPLELLPSRKNATDPDKLLSWIQNNQENVSTVVVSLEMVLYGGLIASRISNETTSTILNRLDRFESILSHIKDVYVSSVVMRIPSYNGDFEEPWYWEDFGKDLFEYSFYRGEYIVTGNETCRREFEKLERDTIPRNVLSKFLWRRERNFNVTRILLERISKNHTMFRNAYITLDDSGTYGLNVVEATALKNLVKTYGNMSDIVRIYPGADEVGLTLLSKSLSFRSNPRVRVVWRVPNATHFIPNFESQAVFLTVQDQLEAAGFKVLPNDSSLSSIQQQIPDLIFAVNNFEISPQLESTKQPDFSPLSDYDDLFRECFSDLSKNVPVAFADVRYSNGADKSFVKYLLSKLKTNMTTRIAYAGWNTDGNTLGTAACNGMLLSQLDDTASKQESAARCFTYLRLVEDCSYQSDVRNVLISKVLEDGGDVTDLTPHLKDYESFVFQHLTNESQSFSTVLNLPFPTLKSVYFPWNRTFEIGLNVNC